MLIPHLWAQKISISQSADIWKWNKMRRLVGTIEIETMEEKRLYFISKVVYHRIGKQSFLIWMFKWKNE